MGDELDFLEDPMMTYMTRFAEEIFEPKRILNDEDWLKKNREQDQTFESYKAGEGSIQWLTGKKNKIYLLFADPSALTD